MAAKKNVWRAVVGITDKTGKRYEPGDTVPDAFVKKHKWLRDRGKVEKG